MQSELSNGFRWLEAEDELQQRELGLKVKYLVVQMFFLSLKCVRGLSTPIESSPSTQSPAVKCTTEGNPLENPFSPSTMFVVKLGANLTTSTPITMIVV